MNACSCESAQYFLVDTMPRTFADKHGLRLGLDQNIGSKLILAVSGDVLHNVNDRGLSNNENNGSPPQAAYSSMPSFIDYRGQCPNGSRVTDPGNPCAGVVYPTTAPYAFSNPFQTVALLLNKEIVWREIMHSILTDRILVVFLERHRVVSAVPRQRFWNTSFARLTADTALDHPA